MGRQRPLTRGIVYVADLKAGPLKDHPVVINMSLGGSRLDALVKAAIDYAIAQGVIVVAAGGNAGTSGMHYPGAAESILTKSAIRLAAGCRTVLDSTGATTEVCWESDATGTGLATADAALAATPKK